MILEKTWVALYKSAKPKSLEQVKKILKKNRGLKEENLKIKEIISNPKRAEIGIEEIEKLAQLITKIKKNNKKILIHGDYDVDGITSTAIFFEFLERIGFDKENIHTFIPNRFKHGYGLSKESLEHLLKTENPKDTPLIVLVDCGITSHKNISTLEKKGFKVAVIDHHTLKEKKPKASYIFWNKKITASALTYLVTSLLEIKINKYTDINKSVDLAALGYVADLGNLKDPIGRAITKKGLYIFNKAIRPNIKALLKKEKNITTFDLGWIIGPRINAAGRIDSPQKALNLILEKEFNNINKMSYEIEKLNTLRQKDTKEMFEQALVGVSNKKYPGLGDNEKIIIVHSKEFHEGIIGLISSRLKQYFFKPAICISWEGDIGKGSCRSIPGVNIVDILKKTSTLLENFGGHSQAAGFTILKKNFEDFESKILDITDKDIPKSALIPKIEYDLNLERDLIKKELLGIISELEPFGNGNPEPLFVTENLVIKDIKILGKEQQHLKLLFEELEIPAIYFNGTKNKAPLNKGDNIKILYSLNENHWQGNTYLQIKINDVKKM